MKSLQNHKWSHCSSLWVLHGYSWKLFITRPTCGKSSSQRLWLPFLIDGEYGNSILCEGRQTLQRECGNRIDFNLQKREGMTVVLDTLYILKTNHFIIICKAFGWQRSYNRKKKKMNNKTNQFTYTYFYFYTLQ